ncbi:MAG: pyruvate dehydrogenase (acetyl-transferring) E1 component subunit alpha [Candidatus Aminicenantes bacterium]|nr:pyruvate dehydrogenase (acetyl-transferring) E1 component subunit alpha [Candidatus Aminicenantes bacterium]
MFQIIDKEGQLGKQPAPELSPEELEKIFRFMLTTRLADDKAFKLQRQGRMGTFAPSLGHEACQVGAAFALEKEDWFFPYFRDLGSYITLGFPLKNYFIYWMGNEKGMEIPAEMNIFPLCVPVASQIPHAVGAAMAAKIKGRKAAVLCTFSDGATSQGDFHEALNFAGVYRTANVFVCYNNQYAISLPRDKQTASSTLAQKAEAYGFPGLLVDGNDVLAMYKSVKEALLNARNGGGPTLIEAYTYRLSNHTTSDDASKYRTAEEAQEWEDKDPLKRFRIYLNNKGIHNPKWEEKIQQGAEAFIEKAVKAAEDTPPPTIEELFTYTYKTLPPDLAEQLEELKTYLKETGQ